MLVVKGAHLMSTSVIDVQALLANDPTFDENDEPVATQHHRDVIDSLYYSLRERLAGPGVSVAAEVRIYRNLAAVAARDFREPDLLVALDRPDHDRVIYLLSDEGKAPDFALEVLSDTTYLNDIGEKRRWYRGIGVREYVVADPEGQFVGERRLQRWRLEGEGPESGVAPGVGLGGGGISSVVLPFDLVVREGWVRLVDPVTGEELPLLREQLAQGRLEAELRREAQAQARDELERRHTSEARQSAAEARQREAELLAQSEAAARLAAEQELARLRQRLQRLNGIDDDES